MASYSNYNNPNILHTKRPSISTVFPTSPTKYSPSTSPNFAATSSFERKASDASISSHSTSASQANSPRVQLVPYARTASFDLGFTDLERQLMERANFDALDLSSKDFDFEDVFTFDKPQKQPVCKVVEVSRPTRDKDFNSFSFSHYAAAVSARQKVHRHSSGVAQAYLRNVTEKRK